jgi:hypothetical protein
VVADEEGSGGGIGGWGEVDVVGCGACGGGVGEVEFLVEVGGPVGWGGLLFAGGRSDGCDAVGGRGGGGVGGGRAALVF